MKSPKITVICIALFLVSVNLFSAGNVKGDGIPITKMEFHGTLRENRQLAYISVDNEGGNMETLNLFLSVVSLYPGNNASVLIPLMTKPEDVSGKETSENEFRQDFNFWHIEREMEKQNHCWEEVMDSTAESMKIIGAMETLGGIAALLYVMVIGFGGSSDGDYYEISEGVSFEVLSFESADSISEYFDSMGTEVPDNVKEIIDEYGEFYLGVINAVTRPPIDEESFEEIERRCPNQLDDFRTFVENNPTIEAYGYSGDYGYYPYYDYPFIDTPELREILYSIQDTELKYKFNMLIAATYGIGPQDGVVISFDLPLKDGQAYFPLGTTPAWNAVPTTQVIFRVDEKWFIDFDKKGEEAFIDGSHYYMWEFNEKAPDHDLVGEVKEAGFGTSVGKSFKDASIWIYDHSTGIGLILSILFFALIWIVGLWLVFRREPYWPDEKHRWPKLVTMGFACMVLSGIFTLVGGLIFAGVWLADIRVKRGLTEHRQFPNALETFFLVTMIGPLIIYLFVLYASVQSIEYDAGMFMYSAILVTSTFSIILIHLLTKKDAGENDTFRMVSWVVYSIIVIPFMFLLFTGVPVCGMLFFFLLILQSMLFIKLEHLRRGDIFEEPKLYHPIL